jgi:hypothetical protein
MPVANRAAAALAAVVPSQAWPNNVLGNGIGNQAAIGSGGVNYLSAVAGTQTYSAGSLSGSVR